MKRPSVLSVILLAVLFSVNLLAEELNTVGNQPRVVTVNGLNLGMKTADVFRNLGSPDSKYRETDEHNGDVFQRCVFTEEEIEIWLRDGLVVGIQGKGCRVAINDEELLVGMSLQSATRVLDLYSTKKQQIPLSDLFQTDVWECGETSISCISKNGTVTEFVVAPAFLPES